MNTLKISILIYNSFLGMNSCFVLNHEMSVNKILDF